MRNLGSDTICKGGEVREIIGLESTNNNLVIDTVLAKIDPLMR